MWIENLKDIAKDPMNWVYLVAILLILWILV